MATCRQIVTEALRKAKVIGSGESAQDDEAQDALEVLQSIYDELIAKGVFGRLKDLRPAAALATTNEQPLENVRIFNSIDTPVTVTLPEAVYDVSSDFNDYMRPPRDRALVIIVGGTPGAYVWSAMRGSWDRMSSLALSDFAPFSERSRDGLSALLAVRLVEEFGGAVTPGMQAAAARFRSLLSSSADTERQETEAAYY